MRKVKIEIRKNEKSEQKEGNGFNTTYPERGHGFGESAREAKKRTG